MEIKGSKKLFWWAFTGLVIVIIGLILAFAVFPFIISDTIYKQVRLKNGTDQYERWRELPVALEFKFYLFNITNPDEVTHKGAYPIVKEVGPYIYREFRVKRNITYDEEADTLNYIQFAHFEFDEEKSPGLSPDDRIWTLNAGLNAVLQLASRYLPELLMSAIVDGTWGYMFHDTNNSMFHNVRVGDLLFDGIPFCDPENWSELAGLACLFAALLDIKFLRLQDDYSMKFTFFDFKQDKHDGVFTVNAGIKDVTKLGAMVDWNGMTYDTIWGNGERFAHCNKIKGRDGTIYPPNIQREDTFDVYSTEICRVGKARYSRDQTVKGIDAHRRVLGREIYAHPDEFPDNYCYCGKHERNIFGERECLPTGFADLSQCHIAPVIVSNPHFLFGDEEYSKTVIGLSPDQDAHETFLAMEPITGTPLEGRKRLQFNMVLRPIDGITITKNLNYSITPIAWVEEGLLVPDDLADQFKSLFYAAMLAVEIIQWTIVAIGGLLFVICGGLWYYKLKKNK